MFFLHFYPLVHFGDFCWNPSFASLSLFPSSTPSILVAYPDLSQPHPFTTGKQKGFGNSPLSFTGCKFCYLSTSLGPFRLQSSKWKIDIFLSFPLSPDDPEFGDRPSHVHNVLINDDSFNFCQRCGFRKDPVVVDNT